MFGAQRSPKLHPIESILNNFYDSALCLKKSATHFVDVFRAKSLGGVVQAVFTFVFGLLATAWHILKNTLFDIPMHTLGFVAGLCMTPIKNKKPAPLPKPVVAANAPMAPRPAPAHPMPPAPKATAGVSTSRSP